MYKVELQKGKSFFCESSETIIAGALRNGIFLDHSCLSGRCSSCKFKILSGQTICEIDELPLSESEKSQGYILSCIRKPVSNIVIEAEDLSEYGLLKPKTIPAKINDITKLTENIIKVNLRFPPNEKPTFLEGQYINVIKGNLKRSYSIASSRESEKLELIVKNYRGGEMSKFWFEEAKINDLVRIEIPKGTFFFRNFNNIDNIIFLATGTGIAPIKSIFESKLFQEKMKSFKRVIILWGMKSKNDIFWRPEINVEFIPVLSRESFPKKYVQNFVQELNLNFDKAAIYACGSDTMIQQVREIAIEKGLSSNNFYSDAFVPSN